ncbi:Transposase [Micromonospora inyonensis]|uniref:Transposase n=1 Tax=Micromonospora inyonensis TaxID=47866 RepID=A0A1C6RFM3_9ACTN|nr:Transposase [Micromonospora inyonensis]
MLPDRTAHTLEAWLREHPGVQVVCRDGPATYAKAIRRALPDAVQVADRWHLWHNLCEAALSEVKAHSTCWAAVLDAPLYDGPRARTTLQRWHQVHDLLDQGVGLLECARRLQLALNTVKRYARTDRPQRMLRVPKYRASLVDPHREHLRKRRAEDPGVPVKHLFEEIKALGYTGCLNLLHKYINQGTLVRVDEVAERIPTAEWQLHSCRPGAKGPRDYLWAWITTATRPGEHRWLLIRRNRTTGELAFYLCWSPRPVPLHTLVTVAGSRWSIEELFQTGKDQVGLNQYQVRGWTG